MVSKISRRFPSESLGRSNTSQKFSAWRACSAIQRADWIKRLLPPCCRTAYLGILRHTQPTVPSWHTFFNLNVVWYQIWVDCKAAGTLQSFFILSHCRDGSGSVAKTASLVGDSEMSVLRLQPITPGAKTGTSLDSLSFQVIDAI